MSKFSRIRSPRRRLVLSLYLSFLGWIDQLTPRRAQAHWIGRSKRRRRPQRILLVSMLLLSELLVPRQHMMLWSIMWGGTFAIFVNLFAIYRLWPRRRAHWI